MSAYIKEIPSIPGYFVSKHGDVYRLNKDKEFVICSTNIEYNGYERVSIKGTGYRVHRLVAETFIPNPKDYPVINHIDANRKNNILENLEWCTYAMNNEHAKLNPNNNIKRKELDTEVREVRKTVTKKLPTNAKFTMEEANNIRKEYLETQTSQRKLAEKYGTTKTSIADLLNGKIYVDENTKYLVKNKDYRRFTDNQIKEIRKLHATGEYSYNKLGNLFNVDHKTIKKIVDRKSYADVE